MLNTIAKSTPPKIGQQCEFPRMTGLSGPTIARYHSPMLTVLQHPIFRRLFMAQVIALVGTGLLTVALGLLAYDLAGDNAGAVLGTAYAIKMVAYVGLSPLAHAIIGKLPRKSVMIGADILRAAVALCLPFVSEAWHIYVLIFVLQAASATFTPTFQAVIPDILTDEDDYTNALSLSRLAYDIENVVSPAMAAFLLTIMGYHWLFGGTVIGFLGSALLVAATVLPTQKIAREKRGFMDRLTRGIRIYLGTQRLRGLLALTLVAASTSAFVLVNTVVMVRGQYDASASHVAQALMAYGGGSIAAAMAVPRLLKHFPDRSLMLTTGWLLAIVTLGHGVVFLMSGLLSWTCFLIVWAISGALYSATMTPSGRLIRRSTGPEDRAAVFTAQFSLSHACWLVTYPLAGWIGVAYGMPAALITLGILAMIAAIAAVFIWPAKKTAVIAP